MALPNRNKIEVDITPSEIARIRQLELLVKTDPKTTFLPKGIGFRDMDLAVNNELKEKRLQLVLKDKKGEDKPVPVFYLTTERWAEFSKTWQIMDDDKNLVTPFITIVREGRPEYGDYGGLKYNIPERRLYKYLDVPNFDGKYCNIVRYKIPQPVHVQVTYNVKFFTKFVRDMNEFDNIMMTNFSSRQLYIDVNGYYMPLLLESSGDENQIDDKNGERLYVASYELKLSGKLINEKEFEVVETIKKINLSFNDGSVNKQTRNQSNNKIFDHRNI